MLRRSLLSAAAALISVPALPRLAAASAEYGGSDRPILHVLDRLAFGPNPADVAHVRALGVAGYVAEQLHPENLSDPPELSERLAALGTLHLDPVQLFREYGPLLPVPGIKATPEEQKARRQRANIIRQDASAARVWRALYSPRQLQEVMVDFWYNHFNVFAGKGLDHLWIGAYEEEAIRPHALGRFRDLLGATARHPAMLFYLDNFQNSAPGTEGPNGGRTGLNENYAREVMELHTLGADGGYSQDDVIALARILTGWSLMRPKALPPSGSGFAFYPGRHDGGAKRLLGREVVPSGEAEGEEALDMLAKRPATARHIAAQLAAYFVADNPPTDLVDRLAGRFAATDGDIRGVLQALFASREFADSSGAKYKSPYRFVLSAARAAAVAVDNPRPLLGTMARLGQPLYGCQTPDGYRDSEDVWLSPDATMLRISFATVLGAGRLPLRGSLDGSTPILQASAPSVEPVDAAALEHLLGPKFTAKTLAAVAAAPPPLRAALLLGSPDFMAR